MRLSLLLPAVVALISLATISPAMADAGGGPAVAPDRTGCPIEAWGSLPRDAPGMAPGFIDQVRIGQGPCADRIVFDVTGPTPGWHVAYVSQITQDGSGRVLPVAGGARLLIVIRTNAHNIDTGVVTLQRLPNVPPGFRTFRGLVFAGDFEGITTLGLGVRTRLPFRTFSLPGPKKGHNRVIIDVAHTWR